MFGAILLTNITCTEQARPVARMEARMEQRRQSVLLCHQHAARKLSVQPVGPTGGIALGLRGHRPIFDSTPGCWHRFRYNFTW